MCLKHYTHNLFIALCLDCGIGYTLFGRMNIHSFEHFVHIVWIMAYILSTALQTILNIPYKLCFEHCVKIVSYIVAYKLVGTVSTMCWKH